MSKVIPIKACGCCSGTGVVEAGTTDGQRPCSRCQYDAFHRWYGNLVQSDRVQRLAASIREGDGGPHAPG